MNEILTAEEFISPKQKEIHGNMVKFSKGELTKEEADDVFSKIKIWNTEEGIKALMIEFAKYRVQQALEAAITFEVDGCGCGESSIIEKHIKNAYSLENIK